MAATDHAPSPAFAPPLGYAAGFAFLLASFPARNADVWGHLAAGRAVAAGELSAASPTWLFDLIAYLIVSVAGGSGLVLAKAVLVGIAGAVVVRAGRTSGGWLIPVACAVLAMLATGTRLLIQPATASVLFLALTVWLLRRDDRPTAWPGWRLAVLFLIWANADRWFLAGLGVTALTWLGRELDGRSAGNLTKRATAVGVLVAITLLNPAHLTGYPLPADLGGSGGITSRQIGSPFSRIYLSAFATDPAGLAFYPLFVLGLLSFLIARPRLERLLPWAGMAVLAGVQARTIPLFAVIAGPVLAWNLQDVFARRRELTAPSRRRLPGWVGGALVAALAVAFLAAAWPGWLQKPPYGRRSWTLDPPAGVEHAAAAVRMMALPAGSKTLHLSAETAAGFRWFAPDDPAVVDDRLAAAITGATDDPADLTLAAAGVSRVVASVADRGRQASAFEFLLADPDRWPLLHLRDGLAVFGRRDPAAGPDPGPGFDFDRAAFRPSADAVAPAVGPARPDTPRWWEAFLRPLPPVPSDREQARALLVKAELLRLKAPERHMQVWQASQVAGLTAVLASSGSPAGAAADSALRFTLFSPPMPNANSLPLPVTPAVIGITRRFAYQQDDTPPAVLALAVRASRRAVAADPTDAAAYLSLGQAYSRMLGATRERVWTGRLQQIGRLRQVQAVTALYRAVALSKGKESATAHLRLGRAYEQLGVLDGAYTELTKFRELTAQAGRPDPDEPTGGLPTDAELRELGGQLAEQTKQFEDESKRTRVFDRALMAVRRGLVVRGRDILLGSDIAAFGSQGLEMEIDLLLRTGRADDVIAWVGDDLKAHLGSEYHWHRAQALAATGQYAAADTELAALSGADRPFLPPAAADAFARQVQAAIYDGATGGPLFPEVVLRALSQARFEDELYQFVSRMTDRSNALTLRGLVALEAGDVAKSEEAFRSAFLYTGGPTGGLRFGGQPVAEAGLGWIAAAKP